MMYKIWLRLFGGNPKTFSDYVNLALTHSGTSLIDLENCSSEELRVTIRYMDSKSRDQNAMRKFKKLMSISGYTIKSITSVRNMYSRSETIHFWKMG